MRCLTILHKVSLVLQFVLLLEPIELVVLEKDRLLNHGLVWLSKKVVFLHTLVVWADHLGQITLQVVILESLLWLAAQVWLGLYLLVVRSHQLLRCALLD